MCGRFSFFDVEKIHDRFGTVNTLEITPSYNISPGANTAVITRHSPVKVELMKWGLIPFWAKDPKIGAKMFNARAETIMDKPSFKRAIKHQRCLVPVNGFYEWRHEEDYIDSRLRGNDREKQSIPYLFRLKDEPIFALAGIYDCWYDPKQRPIYSFAIITTTANKVMAPIHERMPVILRREDEKGWLEEVEELGELPSKFSEGNLLDKGTLGVLELLKPYEGKDLVVEEVSQTNF